MTAAAGSGRKDLLARMMGAFGLPAAMHSFNVGATNVPILAYHRVLDLPADIDDYPYNPELVIASVAAFAAQMRHIKQHLNPITFARLRAAIDGDEPLPPRPVIVTFDDGFDDNYRYAFPILAELRIPATFFLATGYVGAADSFWFEHLYGLIVHSAPATLSLAVLAKRITVGNTPALRRQTALDLLQIVKHMPDADRRSMLAEVEAQLAPTAELQRYRAWSQPMTWQQVGDMATAGMEFGSHTVTHPVLPHTSDEDLAWGLAWSRRTLEQHLQRDCKVFCYPMGLCRYAHGSRSGGGGLRFCCRLPAWHKPLRRAAPVPATKTACRTLY